MYKSVNFIGYKDNLRMCMPTFIFDGSQTDKLTVYYQGTAEDFDKIYFNDPYTNPENLTFNQAHYDHVKSFVTFKD